MSATEAFLSKFQQNPKQGADECGECIRMWMQLKVMRVVVLEKGGSG